MGTRAGSAAVMLARFIMAVAGIISMIIATGILAVVLEADPDNSIVSTVLDVAKALVGPLDGMFSPEDPKVAVAVNWGIAIVVYLVVGRVLAWVIRRLGAGRRTARGRGA